LDGIVRSVELLGHEQHVIIEVSGELMVIRQPSEEPDPVLGTTVRLSPELDRLHIFDKTSGLRVE